MLSTRHLAIALLALIALTATAPSAQAASGDRVLVAQAAEPRASGKDGTTASSDSGGTSAEKAGKELGNIVFAWAGTIVFAIAAMMVAVAIGRRNVGELVTIMLITGAGSLFVLNKASGAQTLFESIIKQIT
jgi:hypothetical protein